MAEVLVQNPYAAARTAGEPSKFRRSMRIESIDEAARTATLSFSSDVDLERWPGFFEKLDHSPGAVDLSRLQNGANALWNHDWDECIGVIDRAWVDGGKGYVTIRFGNSDRAVQVWPDVRDKICRNVSVGYEVLAEQLTLNDETGCHYLITRWRPYEVSVVTVPADITVGVDRNLRSASLNSPSNKTMSTTTETPPKAAPETAARAKPDAVEVNEPNPAENAKRLIAIGAKFNAVREAADAVAAGETVEQFQERLLARNIKAAGAAKTDHELGLSNNEIQRFSMARLIAAEVAGAMSPGDARALREAAAFEYEVVEAAADRRKKAGAPAPRGFFIPEEILKQGRVKLSDDQSRTLAEKQRTIAVSTGDANIPSTFQPLLDTASFAELLRPECLLMNLATVIDGLAGTSTFEIPKQVSGSSAGWLAEDGAAPGQDAVFTMVSATPHTAAANIEITRRALLQSALDLESLLRTDLARGLGQVIDAAGYYGSGENGQPSGLTITDGIKTLAFAGTVAGTDGFSPEWAELVKMETLISQSNVKLSPASGAYLTNSYGRGWAKTRQKFPGTPTGATIWEPGDTINGYTTGITNQIMLGHWFLANWKELYMPRWSGMDMIVDPFTRSKQGRVSITVMQDVDFVFRRPEAFVYGAKTP